jgi:hypothetical protein
VARCETPGSSSWLISKYSSSHPYVPLHKGVRAQWDARKSTRTYLELNAKSCVISPASSVQSTTTSFNLLILYRHNIILIFTTYINGIPICDS